MECNSSRLFNGMLCGNIQYVNGVEVFKQPSSKFASFSIKANGKIKSALFSAENGSLPRSAGSDVASNALVSDVSGGVEVQSDSVVLGALAADMAPTASGFPLESDEYDLDMPSQGFSSIPEAIKDIREGKVRSLRGLCYNWMWI